MSSSSSSSSPSAAAAVVSVADAAAVVVELPPAAADGVVVVGESLVELPTESVCIELADEDELDDCEVSVSLADAAPELRSPVDVSCTGRAKSG
jgi:hypothetical protein